MQELIRRLNRENPLWSAERIRDTLLLLRCYPPREDTIRKYMVKPKNPQGKSVTWLPFLRNHLDVSWAIDFFTVTTIRFATLYVFLVLSHGRRKILHLAITSNPSMRWVIQQLREAMPYGHQPRFLFLDNDGIYGSGVGEFLDSCGIEEVRTAYRCPLARLGGPGGVAVASPAASRPQWRHADSAAEGRCSDHRPDQADLRAHPGRTAPSPSAGGGVTIRAEPHHYWPVRPA